jgi:predicted CXXCH cytochrome family protein
MKKLLLAVVLGLLFVAAFSTLALADNGPHGGFNGSTEACASCHRAHSAVSTDGMLLVASDIYTLCTNCHNGTGAYTNVVDGYYDTQVGSASKATWAGGWGDANHGLFGGGFENARMLTDFGNASNEGGLANATTNTGADQNTSATSWARFNAYDTVTLAPVGRTVTSTHDVITAGRTGVVWGSGNINAGGTLANNWGAGNFTGATELECTSCHDPHGNAGRWQGATGNMAPYPSYRLLRFTPEGSNGFEVASEVGTGATSAGIYWQTNTTWTAANGIAAAFNTQPVIPTTAGVMVPDTTVKWYSVNNDYTLDNTLTAYRGRGGSGEIYVANFAGQGDYMGRYYGYKRPSATINGPGAGTRITCWNGTVMTGTSTDCPGGTGGTAFNNQAPHDVLGFWCSTCHDRYLAPGGAPGSRDINSGDPGYHFRHRAVASGNIAGTGTYTCVDCHNAHGTVATANALASSATYAADSALLKGDNRAVCVRCHAGAVNFFNISTSPTAPMVLP